MSPEEFKELARKQGEFFGLVQENYIDFIVDECG